MKVVDSDEEDDAAVIETQQKTNRSQKQPNLSKQEAIRKIEKAYQDYAQR